MSYGWAEHVGELELRLEADDEPAVFVEALRALSELLGGDAPAGESGREWRDVIAVGDERAVLLAAWLEELNFLAETEGFVPEAVDAIDLDHGRLSARVRGRLGDPPHLVKAVTYHRLSFEPVDGHWQAVAVLDV
jgi:SHS2 domain-containing protein